ncbi:MAG: hypothetical protein ABIK33_03990 [candidate division WOR-3 bacterium]
MDKINNKDKKWDDMTLEEKKQELQKIAELLNSESLDNEKLLDNKYFENLRNKTTRRFLKAIKDKIESKNKNFEIKDYNPGQAKEHRVSFDYLTIGDNLRVSIGYSTLDSDSKFRKSSWWGYFEIVDESDIDDKIKEIKSKKLNVEKFQESWGEKGGMYYVIASTSKNHLSPEELKKIENPDKLIEDITNELIDLHDKISGGSNSGNNKGKNKIISMLNAIETKPFIILSGISGTGKTQIARIISAGIVKEKE